MTESDDIIIVGAGPAGTSAALALAGSGLRVRLLDAGEATISLPPDGNYLDMRASDPEQWQWQIGKSFAALRASAGNSPKLRIPGLRQMFEGYAQANQIDAVDGFRVVGALAAGGLSNAWGCGVAAFNSSELAPLDASERSAMAAGYARAAGRMGLSGVSSDEMGEFLGVDEWAQPAIAMDALHHHIFSRHRPGQQDFRLGRARVAVLSGASPDPLRQPCDSSGLCLWGCPRRATWSAAMDMDRVRRSAVSVDGGVLVRKLEREAGGWRLECTARGSPRQFRASRVLLAAGTLASTRLALASLPNRPASVRLQSNPMAAFLAFVPARFGSTHERGFGLAQLSFAVQSQQGRDSAFGNLFSTSGLPISEFLAYLPVTRRAGIPLLRAILPACVVGNVFLPGELSNHRVELGKQDELRVHGATSVEALSELGSVRAIVSRGLRAAGAWMLPGSFVPGQPGADLHYACTLPMARDPLANETRTNGELAGLPGVFVIDGASLSRLPAKAHTLTIMANADRIARGLMA